LNPHGDARAFYPTVVSKLIERYNFQKFPEKLEDFDETKGVTFATGVYRDIVIEQLVIYRYGIVVDTRASTEVSQRLLEDALEWGAKEFGLVYKRGVIKRWQYQSQLVFTSSVRLDAAHIAFQRLAKGLNNFFADEVPRVPPYEVVSINWNFDQLERKHPLGYFTIQRRENVPFADNKYFSDAPISTEAHIALLRQFEQDIYSKSDAYISAKPPDVGR